MNGNKILTFLDVSFKDKLKQINFSLKKGNDLIIYSSDDSLPFAFKELLILKNKNYNGSIFVGDKLLKKNNKDFLLDTKILSVFSRKNNTSYYSKCLYDVLKFSFINNNYTFEIFNDFLKDWKSVSEEYEYDIKQDEISDLIKFTNLKIKYFEEFLNSEYLKNFFKNQSKIINDIENYLEIKINFLKKILNVNTIFEIKKYENYLKYQNKFRNNEGKIHELKIKSLEIKEKIDNFSETSDYNKIVNKKTSIIQDLTKNISKLKKILSNGYDNYEFYKFLVKNFNSKIVLAKKELKNEYKNKNQEAIYKAKVNLLVKIKTKKIFKKYKKYYKYIGNNLLNRFYVSLSKFEYKMFNDVYFLFKRKKHLNSRSYNFFSFENSFKNDKTHIFNIIKYKNQKNYNDLNEKLKTLSLKLSKAKRINTNNFSKKINNYTLLNLKNQFYKYNADYNWAKNQNNEKIKKQIEENTKIIFEIEKKLVNYMYKATKLDKELFLNIKKDYNFLSEEKQRDIEQKIKNIKNLTQLQSTIYKFYDFIYDNHLDEENTIIKIIYKKEMKDLLNKINLSTEKLWQSYSEFTLEEKINLEIAKYSLYKPKISLLNLELTLFDETYIDKLIELKDPNSSLIIFSQHFIDAKKIKNYLFIEKGKIIESSFDNNNLKFESKFAQSFVQNKEFNLNLLYTITDKEYEEIYKSRKNTKINNSTIYTSESDLVLLNVTYERNSELNDKNDNDIINIDDELIIDKTLVKEINENN
ncbi:hypothetical protein [[Mycoplasma] collis]|uniref:hypothetical protein n=1 Tax=[Mycoplasma] collis TaxID=2127 RepID=UPI00051AE6EE|nr:hypothetical protein [[Mycoplasma] collis]